jgi:hypothetical protein
MPDLAATADVTGDGELKPVSRMTDDELEAIAAGRSSGASPAPEGSRQLN